MLCHILFYSSYMQFGTARNYRQESGTNFNFMLILFLTTFLFFLFFVEFNRFNGVRSVQVRMVLVLRKRRKNYVFSWCSFDLKVKVSIFVGWTDFCSVTNIFVHVLHWIKDFMNFNIFCDRNRHKANRFQLLSNEVGNNYCKRVGIFFIQEKLLGPLCVLF